MMSEPRGRHRAIYCQRILSPFKIAEIGVTTRFSHDREGFYARRTKSFAIMKDGREYEVSGILGAGVTRYAAPGRGLS
jgi:hypothetical protein